MAIDQKTMLQTIYDRIFDALTTSPSGIGDGKPIADADKTYLSLSIPGQGVDPTQFANMWSPENPVGSVGAAENFATLVDAAPIMDPKYGASGNSIDGFYGEIVNANVAPPSPDPEGQAAFDRAEQLLFTDGTDFNDLGQPVTVRVDSPLFRNYKNKRKAYEDALTAYLVNFIDFDLSDPADQRKWAILQPVLQGPVDRAFGELQAARPGIIESALSTMGQFQQSSLARIFATARQNYEQTRRGSLVGNPPWHVCQAFPANWFAESGRVNFTTMTFSSKRVRVNENSRFTSVGGGGGVNFGLWSVGASASHERTQHDISTETSDMTISFKLGRVEIRRRWFENRLLSLTGWSTAGRAPGSYSNGDGNTNPGVFPLLPTAMLIVSDLKISANWGSSDMHFASQATKVDANVGFAFWQASGKFENTSSTRTFKSDFDGTTLSIPGMNIMGWESAVVPFSPPAGGPPAQPTAGSASGARRNPYAEPYIQSSPAPTSWEESELAGNGASTDSNGDGQAHPVSVPAGAPDSHPSKWTSAER